MNKKEILSDLKKKTGKKKNQKNQGMLLIDVIISIAILAIISISTARLLYQALLDKGKIEKKIEVTSKISNLRRLLISDIQKAFHFQDINIIIYNHIQNERIKNLSDKYKEYEDSNTTKKEQFREDNPTLPTNQNDLNKRISKYRNRMRTHKVLTHFLGDKESFYFTTLNNIRTLKDSQISDLIEVGYFLKTCSSRKKENHKSKCLWRSVSFVIDDNVTKGGEKRVVLENVKKITFSYTGESKKEEKALEKWEDRWRSNHLGSPATRKKFPTAVKIFLEFQIEKAKNKMQLHTLDFIVTLNFPNNTPFKSRIQSGT